LSEAGKIDLIYADAARVSLQPCAPYGWQFGDEDVFMPSEQGGGLNCFAFLTRQNRCHFTTSCERITSEFVFEQLEQVSMRLEKLTVVVLDNASAHQAGRIQAIVLPMMKTSQKREPLLRIRA
jgi:hypothetical protein